jgi:quercetin 2,3-dioxygenase
LIFSVVIVCHAKPLDEPVAFGGPFVMNTREQIEEAYQDYHDGKFGEWPHEQ